MVSDFFFGFSGWSVSEMSFFLGWKCYFFSLIAKSYKKLAQINVQKYLWSYMFL